MQQYKKKQQMLPRASCCHYRTADDSLGILSIDTQVSGIDTHIYLHGYIEFYTDTIIEYQSRGIVKHRDEVKKAQFLPQT